MVLADGSEPQPALFDTGSGGHVQESCDWWVYDGTRRAPLATQLRASSSCGWRGENCYLLDWTQVGRHGTDLFDLAGP
ncbi:hypothetical protein OG782_00480 [Streptomyces sp. NBC_00876]|uniref:hypothetical protein n=1 Tax=Streptomyces sp. NBC_00876 TaxID=2975853 RepID=UPI00386EA425|nr:hypothetical protein OG782_00480 [Streptomyces sp. NBC_00876]